MQVLKQNTGITLKIGSFVDATDGITPETGITLGAADQAELLKAGSTSVTDISGNVFGAITDCDGWYWLTLTAAQLDTVGLLTIVIQDASVCLPIWREYMVLSGYVYNSFVVTSDYFDVNVVQWNGTAVLAPGVAGTPDVNAKLIGGTAQTGNDIGADVNEILTDTGTTLDDLVDEVESLLKDATYGLSALKTLIDAVPTVAEIQAEMEENGASVLDTIRDAIVSTSYGLLTIKDGVDNTYEEVHLGVYTYLATLLTRLSALRAGYLDNLSAGAVALEATLTAIKGAGWSTETLAAIDVLIDAIKAKTDLLPSGVAKGAAFTLSFFMALSSDHVTPATGKTVTVQVSKDGGAFAAATNSPAEISAGWYKIILTATEMNADTVAIKITETDCDQANILLATST